MGDLIDRQAAIDTLMEKDKKLRNINWYDKPYAEAECRGIDEALSIISNLPSAQPELCLDLIVSEIEETIRETKENGKHHEIHVRINGAMICFGLQLALEIIGEKRNERFDK